MMPIYIYFSSQDFNRGQQGIMVDRSLDASHLSELVHLELLQHAKSVYEELGTCEYLS